jgi:hypothetical protein
LERIFEAELEKDFGIHYYHHDQRSSGAHTNERNENSALDGHSFGRLSNRFLQHRKNIPSPLHHGPDNLVSDFMRDNFRLRQAEKRGRRK